MAKTKSFIRGSYLTRIEYELNKPQIVLSEKNKARLAAFLALPEDTQIHLDLMIIRIVEGKKVYGISWLSAFEVVASCGEFLAKKVSA